MFGNKDYITEEQLNEVQKRIDGLEAKLKALNASSQALEEKMGALCETLEKMMTEQAKDGSETTSDSVTPFENLGKIEHTNPSPNGGGEETALPSWGEAERLLFLPSPTPSGSFTEWSDEEQIGKSIYELTTDGKGNGTFRLLPSADALATAMISVSQFVKPVCRIQGNTHHMPESIITVSPGEAQLKDGVWMVTKKAVVEFR